MKLFSNLYEKKLKSSIKNIPKNIVLVLTETDLLNPNGSEKMRDFVLWCDEMKIHTLMIYVSLIEIDADINREICNNIIKEISEKISDITHNISIIKRGDIKRFRPFKDNLQNKDIKIDISLGFSGKYELTHSIKQIMKNVKNGKLSPEDIDAKVIESFLLFKIEPDLVIRAGGKRLTDFLIWQSVYSELYFTDVNWTDFRKIDFLRILRDYQKRQRKFGN